MTMAQCNAAMEAAVKDSDANAVDEGKPGIDGNLHFSTRENWEIWKQTRGLNGG
jgi:hypothetical protein